MRQTKSSLARRFMLWFLKYPPFSPYVSCTAALDFSVGRTYLERINADETEPRVTVQHLVTAALARVYREIPVANGMVLGGHIYRHEHVSVAMPVNLLDQDGADLETTIIIVERVDELSLRDLAKATRRRVRDERAGGPQHPVLQRLTPLAERAPAWLFNLALDAVDAALHLPPIGRALHSLAPVTTAITNPGAGFQMPAGGVFRGAAFSPPDRLFPLGTLLGLSAVQDEPVVIDGRLEVRPMLPLTYVFDHRLFDGVLCSRILRRLAEVLLAPEEAFGTDGTAPA